MAAPDDAENNNINAVNFQELKDIELNNKLANIHPIFSSVDEVRKQIYFMIISLRKSWSNSEYITIGIGSLAVLLGAITFDGELQQGGDYLKVGIAPLGDGLSAISPASFFQLILSMICWIYFLYRLWNHYPLMRGQSISLFIMWFSITITALSLHQGAPSFPLEISTEGLTTAIGGLVVAVFLGFIFSRAVIETRDIHVEENFQNEDPRIMGESIYNHSLFGWVSILIIWSVVSFLSSWAGAHYVSIRPHGSWFWQLLYILFGTFSIFGICVLLWYPQLMLGTGKNVIKSKRAREVDDMLLGDEAWKEEQGKCPDCDAPSPVTRGRDGLPNLNCKIENCNGRGPINSKCPLCEEKIPSRIKCEKCGVSAPALKHLSDQEAW
ncbi:MAG: hypothetical protein VX277_02920 [Candidatus Thermoplasmatota archaeon]|nr:hypothetical protein [Candidatus Thermoplasmatota archaeon]